MLGYIGSKFALLGFIYDKAKTEVGCLSDKTFCDIFAGAGSVGNFFKDKVNKIVSNDMEYYSYVINRNLIQNYRKIYFDFDELNKIEGVEGFIYHNYSLAGNRKYFTENNAKKIDAVRQNIEKYRNDEDLYFFLLASLLDNVDKIANTTAVYNAYLKKFKSSALSDIIIRPYFFKETPNKDNIVYQEDSNELIRRISGDILYLDPPYNHRQYGANYHILNTIAKYEEFIPRGVTGLPEYEKSAYCKKNDAKDCLEDLINYSDFEFIFLSYNNEGIIKKEEIEEMFLKYGEYKLFSKEHRRYRSGNWKQDTSTTIEYLHFCRKH